MSFYKLMGTGKNGTFDIKPDLNQWAYLWVWNSESDYRKFLEVSYISKYLKKFADEFFTIYLSPKQSHGFWDRKQPFASNTHTSFGIEEPIVVLTRATIKLKKAKDFWKYTLGNSALENSELFKQYGWWSAKDLASYLAVCHL